jgi:hypothetical protein
MTDVATLDSVADPEADWLIGSSLQLPRFLSGNCISCQNWSPTKGTCSAIPLAKNNARVTVPAGEVVTDAVFGCALYAEVAPAVAVDPRPGETTAAFAAEEDALMERTRLAIKLGLLDPMPDDFEGGGPGIAREKERRALRKGEAVPTDGGDDAGPRDRKGPEREA